MTPAAANVALEAAWDRLDATTHQLADVITESLDQREFPSLMRIAAIARVCGAASSGFHIVVVESPELLAKVRMIEVVPDIIVMLRAAADLLESANKGRTN